MKKSDGSELELYAALEKLISSETGVSKRQRSLAKYIHENWDKAAFMTIHLLAQAAKVSESTVVRFASDLGFSSFPQLRQQLQEELRKRLSIQVNNAANDPPVDAATIFSECASAAGKSVSSAVNAENVKNIVSAENMLKHCRSIYIYGFESSEFLALYFYDALKLLRKGVILVPESELYLRADMISEADVFICITSAADSSMLSGLLRFIREKAASVLLITEKESIDCIIADVVLTAQTSMAALCILQSIIMIEEHRQGKTVADCAERHNKIRMDNLTYGH